MTDTPASSFHAESPSSRAWTNTAMILASCGVVSTGYYLGATWLAAPILGIPLGLFALPLVYAGSRWGEHVRLKRPAMPSSVFSGLRFWLAEAWTRSHPWAGAPSAFAPHATESFDDDADHESSSEPNAAAVGTRLSAESWQPRRRTAAQARIGVSEDLAGDLAGFSRLATWVRVEGHGDGDSIIRGHDLDALVRRSPGGIEIIADGDQGDDWTQAVRLTYAGVFPARTEPGTMTLTASALEGSCGPELIAALAEAAATHAFARHESAGSPGARVGLAQARAEESMTRLRDLVVRAALRQETNEAARAAASGVSAWLSAWTGDSEPASRLDAFEACAVTSGRDPGVMFRTAAGRFAAGREADGFALAREAAGLVRPASDALNQLPFVQSELELGAPSDVMLLGRVASGLHLCAALADGPSRSHLQDDVLDDMRYSPWLVGRDDARLLLMRVLRGVSGPAAGNQAHAA